MFWNATFQVTTARKCVSVTMFGLLSAPLRAVLHHMFRTGSAPLSFLLTRRILSVPSRQPHHCFPHLPLAQSKQNTARPYALSTFLNSLMGGMCWHLLGLSHLQGWEGMWKRWTEICCWHYLSLCQNSVSLYETSQWQIQNGWKDVIFCIMCS